LHLLAGGISKSSSSWHFLFEGDEGTITEAATDGESGDEMMRLDDDADDDDEDMMMMMNNPNSTRKNLLKLELERAKVNNKVTHVFFQESREPKFDLPLT